MAVDKWKTVNGEITGNMKYKCLGEFFVLVEEFCHECNEHGENEECETCGGDIEYTRRIPIGWDTCKEIYRAMLEAAPDVSDRHD